MPTRHLTQVVMKAIRNERAWGASYREIARRHRLPKSTVYDHARDVKILKAALRRNQ